MGPIVQYSETNSPPIIQTVIYNIHLMSHNSVLHKMQDPIFM